MAGGVICFSAFLLPQEGHAGLLLLPKGSDASNVEEHAEQVKSYVGISVSCAIDHILPDLIRNPSTDSQDGEIRTQVQSAAFQVSECASVEDSSPVHCRCFAYDVHVWNLKTNSSMALPVTGFIPLIFLAFVFSLRYKFPASVLHWRGTSFFLSFE